MISVLDIFRIGIGPSSSHTVGPMRIAKRFILELKDPEIQRLKRIRVILLGSLAFTGQGHGTPNAILMGLLGFSPESVNVPTALKAISVLKQTKRLRLKNDCDIEFDPEFDIVFDYESPAGLHPNEMILEGLEEDDQILKSATFYSTGGGFIATKAQLESPSQDDRVNAGKRVAHEFRSASELSSITSDQGLSIANLMRRNEEGFQSPSELELGLNKIVDTMSACIESGLNTQGKLPGALGVERRAASLWRKCQIPSGTNEKESLFDRLNAFAMAVNEENAAGMQVVTAPTNGAAGIIPAILRHYLLDEGASEDQVHDFLLTAGAIALLFKQRVSISGAAMGCQGEVGVACSMAAAGLAAHWGGSVEQISSAAEIAMEHNLGLTCDPVGGLVQIPCIERNAVGAVKAVNAARLALQRDGPTKVSLDQVIETMRQTGNDMSSKYKETSLGGLAVNVVEC